uniref:Non-specific serine/threonine protein kinase n=1 Tax=Romanomermis culicivorax TaxID=13658 RepID=A0A915JTJ2_ROMCU
MSKDEHIKMPEDDSHLVDSILPSDISAENRDAVKTLISTLRSCDGSIPSVKILRQELRKLLPDESINVEPLIEIWNCLNEEILKFYDASAQTYFQYLNYTDQISSVTINGCLRLLRILTKHFPDLAVGLKSGMHLVRPIHWTTLVPQLSARINHPNNEVQRVITNILIEVAKFSPELVVFPAVIGLPTHCQASELHKNISTPISDEIDVMPENANNEGATCQRLSNPFSSIVDVMNVKYHTLVANSKIFIREMQRLALLREEIWLAALTYAQQEFAKRMKQLKDEIKLMKSDEQLMEDDKTNIRDTKWQILNESILQSLNELYKITSVEAETDNDRWFMKHVSPFIERALEVTNMKVEPEIVWEPFNNLLSSLNARATRRSNWQLTLNQISPILSNLRSTQIPMPGVRKCADGRSIYIESIGSDVVILPTKTRPKKLSFVGSDGKRTSEIYSASNYAVIPLGIRCGLIQWVEKATPIFTIYKRWLIREAAASGKSNVARPSEIFYSRLTPNLQKHNVKDFENRHKWPSSALKDTLNELTTETPRDLLARELWCLSLNTDFWYSSTKNFARATAVMSTIGYIIGLGDRHLDNILVDFHEGNVVHIDYNVCFDKGKQLRVPETVPFRLTPNIQAALGTTGIEGYFRVTCEQALKILRLNKETVLNLLDAFVFDPLVDWTVKKSIGFNYQSHKLCDAFATYIVQNDADSQNFDADSQLNFRGIERNIHAVNVKKRVKLKLEGKDHDSGKRLAVADQVDMMIRDATSFSNLSQMYEGWTAWV